MRVVVYGGTADLAADLTKISKTLPVALRGVIKEGIRVGNSVAKDNAVLTARRHGKHYPDSFTAEMHLGTPPNFYSGEYGPDASKPQGNMSFEYGSRNQPPHLDLAKSADLIGPAVPREALDRVDKAFW